MDEVTQQNAALVEEAAAASESMDEQAKGLQRLIEFFTIDSHTAASMQQQATAPMQMRASAAPQVRRPAPAVPRKVTPAAPARSQSNDSDWEEF